MRYAPVDCMNSERDVLRCLPESLEQKQALLDSQEALGIGCYDGETFVGSVWFYRIEDRGLGSPLAPPWSGWARGSEDARLDLSQLPVELPFLGLSCFHVGRTKALESEDRNDPSYFGKGIGTGLLSAAVQWASQRDYRAIVAMSGIDAFAEFNNWAGTLPLKVYQRQRFNILHSVDAAASLPGHLQELMPEGPLSQAVVGRRVGDGT